NLLTIPPWRRGRKRLTDIELDPLVTDDVSHDLCRADHWDLDLAEDYGITTQPRPYAFDEGVSESDACLLVYLTKAQEFRQQELLYGQLGDGEVEYIVLPRPRTPINSPKASSEAGISTTFQLFPHKVSSRAGTSRTTHLETCDYVTHNALFDDNTPVEMPRILRVESGITVEYLASVAAVGNCFDRIWKWKSSEDGGEY
ncbi:hypothetical protein FOZ63_009449, partial [Perkinsus olseni]